NNAMVHKHCRETKQTLFICEAFDTIGQWQPNLAEWYTMATRQDWKQKGRELKNGLPDQVELVIGMKAMVMMNVNTDLDVANGSHGEIVDIILDLQEEKRGDCAIVELEFSPTYILVKLYRTRA
ncbi:hypothetical protein K439DRAFT_1254910, partial [Ramaria rubella]